MKLKPKGGNMAKEINWDSLGWGEGDDFIHFAFGDFNSKDFGIVRVSDNNRYNNNLAPQMNETVADIPGADGQYYF